MAIPNSPVQICNLALDHLNQSSITSIDSPVDKTEVLCSRWYDIARHMTLAKHNWNCALKRKSIPKNATSPVFGYTDAYDLPNDYVRLIFIGNDEYGGEYIREFAVEGRQVLINGYTSTANALPIKYIKDLTDVSAMDPLFIEVFSLFLAVKMCMKVTNNSALLDRLNNELNSALMDAYSVDGQVDPPERFERSKFRQARRGNSYNVAAKYTVVD